MYSLPCGRDGIYHFNLILKMLQIMKQLLVLIAAATFTLSAIAQSPYVPTEENLKNREAFQDDKFGLFIHWGIYSMLADGEWILHSRKMSNEEYSKLASGFYPSKFDAAAWVAAVKDCGMKYITITSRHHDGFSMWDTRQSDYNIVKATPFKRDILKELADECHKQGIKLGFYYSHLDWSRDDYWPLGRTGHETGRKGGGEWSDYRKFMDAQLTELLTGYGPLNVIWFDGYWDKPIPEVWQLESQYALIHRLQPGCLVGNNHHIKPFGGEDFQMFERDLPGQNTAGHSADSEISSLPLETCETMNGSWGYRLLDNNYRSHKDIIHYLVKAAGNNANLLLNVGPQPNGEIPATSLQRMKDVGVWMRQYGETIYGTRSGIVKPHEWGVTTSKGNKLYVHILKLDDAALYLPIADKKVKKATLFKDKSQVKFTQDKDGVLLKFPAAPTDIDYVVELEF